MNSPSMGDDHLSIIPKTESDLLIKSSVENLVLTPSESEDLSEDLSKDLSDIESECNVPVCDDFTTLSNPLFDADNDFSSSDDKSFSDEDNLWLNQDTSIDFSHSIRIDSLLEEFSGELAHIDLIPPGINETDFDPEEEIPDSPSPIPVYGYDSAYGGDLDLFLTPDDSMPPGIKNDDYDSEGDILFFEELLSNDSPLLLINETFPASSESSMMTLLKRTFLAGMFPFLHSSPLTSLKIAPDYKASRARGYSLAFTNKGYSLKDKNEAKTEHENEKSVESQSKTQSQSQS
ncbi:hypothetical protein Tco_0713972 [Tanacetum coccineum]